jgi:hypothetical protein
VNKIQNLGCSKEEVRTPIFLRKPQIFLLDQKPDLLLTPPSQTSSQTKISGTGHQGGDTTHRANRQTKLKKKINRKKEVTAPTAHIKPQIWGRGTHPPTVPKPQTSLLADTNSINQNLNPKIANPVSSASPGHLLDVKTLDSSSLVLKPFVKTAAAYW